MSESLSVVVVPGAIGLLALFTICAALWYRRGILRALRDEGGVLAALAGATAGEPTTGRLVQAIREHVIDGEDGGEPVRKLVLARPLPELRREYAEDELAHCWAFWLGGLLTGLALLCTFLLIGHVMTSDVSGAIRASMSSEAGASADAGASAAEHLAGAVSALGGKFYISAAGIGGSVLALLVSNWARAGIIRAAEHPSRHHLGAFSSLETAQLSHAAQQLAFSARQLELLTSLETRIEKLNSIEVSVKTIGNEVSANLKNLMKDAIGEQLQGMLADTMVEVATIADRVQKAMSEAFGTQLASLADGMQASLQALQRAIEGQGQGQLEQILGKLQDTVSGGFQSESQKMTQVLERFAAVIPDLEQQLRVMAGQVADDTRQRSEESTRLTQELLGRLGGMLEALGAQQTANAQAIERMAATAEQGAEGMARRLEESGASVVSGVLAASHAQVQAMMQRLQQAAERNLSSHGELEERTGRAAAQVAEAATAVGQASRQLLEISAQTSTVITQARAGSEASQQATQAFVQAGGSLAEAAGGARAAMEVMQAQTAAQQTLLAQHRTHLQEVERIWPTLFTTYLAQFKASADELGRSWEDFYKKLSSASRSVGAEFAESTEQLSSSVERLIKLHGERGAPA